MVYEARMMRLPITKMHGARNDFIVVDQRNVQVRHLASFARWACDRHAGIGADGVIALEASHRADVRMRTINADGSDAEMCGNGIRCAARWLDEAGEGGVRRFETGDAVIATEIVAREPEYLVRVAMGGPRIAPLSLPSLPDAAFVELGNPHVVAFVENIDGIDLDAVAAPLQRLPQFAAGTNLHLAAVSATGALRVRHWERGVGLTMACGTGAVACAAVALQRAMVASPVVVDVPGGTLVVRWDGDGDAELVGPAVRVFDAEIVV